MMLMRQRMRRSGRKTRWQWGYRKVVGGGVIAVIAAVVVGFVVVPSLSGGPGGGSVRGHSAGVASGPVGVGRMRSSLVRLGGDAQSDAPSVVVPEAASFGLGRGGYDSVFCRDAANCIAVGVDDNGSGVVGLTHDGALTWSSPAVPSGVPLLDSVACGDSQHCVAVGQGTILNSADGGVTWQYQPPPTDQTTLLGVSCNAANLCVAAGVAPNSTGPYLPRLETSSDGGVSWRADDVPAGTTGVGAVACPTQTTCIAVGASVMVSTDAGVDWQTRTVAGGMDPLSSVSCADALHCVAVGPNALGALNPSAGAAAIFTADGGQTWSAITAPAATATLSTISCTGDSCTGSGLHLDHTADPPPMVSFDLASRTWSTAGAPGGLSDVTGISCPTAGHCVTVGDEGGSPVAAATSDGSHWVQNRIP